MNYYCPTCDFASDELYQFEIHNDELEKNNGVVRCLTCDSLMHNVTPIQSSGIKIHSISDKHAHITFTKYVGDYIFDRPALTIINTETGEVIDVEKGYVIEGCKHPLIWKALEIWLFERSSDE